MTIGFQCLTTIRYGEQGIGWACADPGWGVGAGGLDPRGKSHVIWVDLDLNPLLPLTTFPSSAHGGGDLFHWNALEQIADQGVTLSQLGAWVWLKMMAFTWLR